ncbi:MAG TPA: hypothetical protein VFC67_08500 [Prolixibacteraceae bacterium]|nr:hypothetical protein [Prolixibacteraceae bacterium]
MLRRKSVAAAASYVWFYNVGADMPTEDKWLFASCTTQTTFEMKGLIPSNKVWFGWQRSLLPECSLIQSL